MKRIAAIFLAAALVMAGCTESPPVPHVEREALRKMLSTDFAMTSVPKEREEDFYRVLQVFAHERRDEMITKVEFTSDSEVAIIFSWSGGFHGGSATVKKKWGKWTVVDKFHAL